MALLAGIRGALAASLIGFAVASPLWDYVHTPDVHYSYFDTGFRLNQNGTGYGACYALRAYYMLRVACVCLCLCVCLCVCVCVCVCACVCVYVCV
jgi:hypothetical protein